MTTGASVGAGPLLLADIGGYTSFLQLVAVAHQDDAFADGSVPAAYALVSSLLDGIVERLVPPFELSKIEGDAVFAYATHVDGLPRGPDLLDWLSECYDHFREQLGAAHEIWTCGCDACARIDGLDLKFILHAGRFVLHDIAGRQELVGAEVVLTHRLLKNRAADLVRTPAYTLVTRAAAVEFDLPTGAAVPMVEAYDHYSPVDTFVFPLRPA